MYGHHLRYRSTGKNANPARGQLTGKMNISLSPFAPENFVSQDGFGSPVPRRPAHSSLRLNHQSSIWCLLTGFLPISAAASNYKFKPPYVIGPVPSLSGHANAYQWCSLPRVHRHRASEPQGSSQRVLPWQVTMDQLICAPLSHTDYRYEVGMLKVPTEHIYRKNKRSLRDLIGFPGGIPSGKNFPICLYTYTIHYIIPGITLTPLKCTTPEAPVHTQVHRPR